MSTPSWHLVDADAIAAANRYTFFKPSRASIAKVRPGEVVKLIFAFASSDPKAPRAERMWVLVDEVGADGTFRGRLDNDPVHIRDLKAGDPIAFDASHVIQTEHPDADDRVERFARRCFVSKRVLGNESRGNESRGDGSAGGGCKVGFLYREAPDEDDDSGWRFMAGDETPEYLSDARHLAYVSLGAVLSVDDSFLHLLDSPEGAEFQRDTDTGEFTPTS